MSTQRPEHECSRQQHFPKSQKWKPPQCPSVDGQTKQAVCTRTVWGQNGVMCWFTPHCESSHILHDSTYVKCQVWPSHRESDHGGQGWGTESGELLPMDMGCPFRVMKCSRIGGDGCTLRCTVPPLSAVSLPMFSVTAVNHGQKILNGKCQK